uniref:Uncharacterized protein n=1 Tax=Hordeum vulgare subsp. vulgare TaxID=112509 RepID=A0A8I7BCM8_HORVV
MSPKEKKKSPSIRSSSQRARIFRTEHLQVSRHGRSPHCERPLQNLHHLPHGRPHRLALLYAPARDAARPAQLTHVRVPHQPLVQERDELPLADLARGPEREVPRAAAAGVPVPPPGDELQQRHAVAVHVRLGRNRQAQHPLRRQVPHRAPRRGQRVAEVPPDELRHAEVGHLGAEGRVQEYVVRLHVAVHDALLALLVEVGEPPGDAGHDPEPCVPVQQPEARAGQGGRQGAVGHVVVDQQPIAPRRAEPAKAYETDVLDHAEGPHLRAELLLPLRRSLEPLDGHRGVATVAERPLVHGAEAPHPQLLGEVTRAPR